jgi:thiamine pyrophosphate-dependent acetolactate synthase large subunit-like protein
MNEMSGAETFVRMLQLFGVKHIFGLCGDTPHEAKAPVSEWVA